MPTREGINGVLAKGISPAGVFFVLTGFFTGLFYTFFGDRPDIQNTLLYKNTIINDLSFYGIAYLIGSIILITGLLLPNRTAISFGAITNAMCVLYAGIVYFTNDFWYPFFVVTVPYFLIYAYMFLAAQVARNLPRG